VSSALTPRSYWKRLARWPVGQEGLTLIDVLSLEGACAWRRAPESAMAFGAAISASIYPWWTKRPFDDACPRQANKDL
jgi:hypothetical protein